MPSRKPALAFVFVTLVLDILGIGLIIPILPRLIESLCGGNVSAASSVYGSLAALYSLMQFVFAPVLGSVWWARLMRKNVPVSPSTTG